MLDPEIYRMQVWQGVNASDISPDMRRFPVSVARQASDDIKEIRDILGIPGEIDEWGMIADKGIDLDPNDSQVDLYDGALFSDLTRGGLPRELRVRPNDRQGLLTTFRPPLTHASGLTLVTSIDAVGRWTTRVNDYGLPVAEGTVSTIDQLDRTPGASLLLAANAVHHVAKMVRMARNH